MKRFSKAAAGSHNEHRIKRYVFVDDQPQEVIYDVSGAQATQKAISVQSKQERIYAVDIQSKTFIKAQTDTKSHLMSKENLIKDRAWLKHAYLHSTSSPITVDEGTRDTKHSHLKESVTPEGNTVTQRQLHSAHTRTNPKSSTKSNQFSKNDAADFTSSSVKETKATVSSRQTETKSEILTNVEMPSVGMKSQAATMKRAHPIKGTSDKNQTVKGRVFIEKTVSRRNKATRKKVSKDERLESNSIAKQQVDITRVKVRPVIDQSTSENPLIEQARVQTSTNRSAERKARSRSMKEMVILKHPRQSSPMNYSDSRREAHLHSDDIMQSTNEVECTARKHRSTVSGMKMYTRNESKEVARNLAKQDALLRDKATPVKRKATCSDVSFPVKHELQNAETVHNEKILNSELMVAHRHNKPRGLVVPYCLKRMPRPEVPQIDDTESKTEKVATGGSKNITTRQHLLKHISSSRPSPTIDGTKEYPQKLRWSWRGNCESQHNQKGVNSKGNASDNIAQLIDCGDEELEFNKDGDPVLPERGYLEDIPFVVNEFDMILRRDPDLPARAYLEDIDFLSKEFDLFFKRKHGSQQCRKTPASNKGANEFGNDEAEAFINVACESPHCQVQSNDQGLKDQNDAAESIFNSPASSYYQPLVFSEDTKPEHAYARALPPKALACSSFTNSSEGPYQPLISEELNTSSLYDHMALKKTEPSTSLLPDPVKTVKLTKETSATSNLVPSSGWSGKGSLPKFQLPNTSDSNSMPLSFVRKCTQHPIHVGLNTDPHQPPTSVTEDASSNNAAYSTEDSYYQPLIFNSHSSPEESNYMPLTMPKLSAAVNKGLDNPYAHQSMKSVPKPLHGGILPGEAMHQTPVMKSLNKQDQGKGHYKHNNSSGLTLFQVPRYDWSAESQKRMLSTKK